MSDDVRAELEELVQELESATEGQSLWPGRIREVAQRLRALLDHTETAN